MAVPTAAPARIPTLDAVRGLALLGILIMNLPGFANSFFIEADGSHHWPGALDQAVAWWRDALFGGKFNSMFSLLFGLGFTIQYRAMEERFGALAARVYLRRLLALLAFGLVHLLLFWGGDVLHLYALLGLVLVLPLRAAGPRTVLALMGLCALYPVVSGALRLVVWTPEVVAHVVQTAKAFEATDNAAYGHGSFAATVAQNLRVAAFFYGDPWQLWNNLSFYMQMALTLLLGVLAGRLQWAQRIPELMPQIRRAQWLALGVGLVCAITSEAIWNANRAPGPSPLKYLAGLLYWIGRPALMVFYVLTIVRLMQHPAWAKRLAPLVLAGRMPLTNYLLQTLVCTTLFRGYGFGLWDRVGPAGQMVVALVVYFGILLPWSAWWLRRHARGPMEALWARLTYGSGRPAVSAARAG